MKKTVNETMESNSKIKFGWFLIILIVVVMFILSFIYINYVKKLIYNNVYNNITEISEQTATQLNLAINDQKYFVKIMTDSINRGHFKTIDDIFERYRGDLENFHFTRLVVLDRNGNGITSDGYEVHNYQNIEEFFNNGSEVYLSENRPSTVSDDQVNIYSRTFKFDGEDKVLMATVNTDRYKDILLRRLFGTGGTYLINKDGIILIDAFSNIYFRRKNINIFDYIKEEYHIPDNDIKQLQNMEASIKQKDEGTFDIRLDDSTYFLHYEKIGINDWYIITILSEQTIAKGLIWLIIISIILCFVVNLVIIGISIYINISNKNKSRRLFKVAFIDSVTSLGNGTYFKEKGNDYLKNQINNTYVLTLDINKFKALNNIYGYDFGNRILLSLSEKLVKTLPKDNITCRISADIFASIFSYDGEIKDLLNKILKDVSNIKIDNERIHLNLSIGIYKLNEEDKDINNALDKAYMARSEIKGLYDNNYHIFDDVLENALVEEQKIESSMEEALKNNEFKVVYQPKTSTKNEKIVGAEALVRWYKDGNVIPPNKFIPLFEKNKFIIKLDLFIFEQVCKDISEWKERYGFFPIISINVSKAHFVNENFIDEYIKILDKYDIKPSQIDLEITESATVDENIDILKILNNIKEKGFIISIDDFGTGYSSLSMLQNMPIDIIKIDKVFVDKADLNSDKNIINYIMILSQQLEKETVVEGIETREQVEFAKKLGCDLIQGYYYSKPIQKEDFEEYFNKNR